VTTAANRIICVGNRYRPEDSAGPLTLAELQARRLPDGWAALDGGLAGLDILPSVEGARRVIFVDSILGDDGAVRVLSADDPLLHADAHYGHGAGLGYLLKLLPAVLKDEVPLLDVVGIPGQPDPELITAAADACLSLASGGPGLEPHGGTR